MEFQVRIDGLRPGSLESVSVVGPNSSFSPDEPNITTSAVNFEQNVTKSKNTCPCSLLNDTCWLVYNSINENRVMHCWFGLGDENCLLLF